MRPFGHEPDRQTMLAWWAVGAAVIAIVALAIGHTLLRWLTLD